MVLSAKSRPVCDVLMNALDGRPLFREWANVKQLRTTPLTKPTKAEFLESGQVLSGFNAVQCTINLAFCHKRRLHDHKRPLPLRFFGCLEAGHVVCPPKTLKRHYCIVDVIVLFDQELRCVGNGEKRLHSLFVHLRGVRVAFAVDHQKVEQGNIHLRNNLCGWPVKPLQLSFEVDLFHELTIGIQPAVASFIQYRRVGCAAQRKNAEWSEAQAQPSANDWTMSAAGRTRLTSPTPAPAYSAIASMFPVVSATGAAK